MLLDESPDTSLLSYVPEHWMMSSKEVIKDLQWVHHKI